MGGGIRGEGEVKALYTQICTNVDLCEEMNDIARETQVRITKSSSHPSENVNKKKTESSRQEMECGNLHTIGETSTMESSTKVVQNLKLALGDCISQGSLEEQSYRAYRMIASLNVPGLQTGSSLETGCLVGIPSCRDSMELFFQLFENCFAYTDQIKMQYASYLFHA